MEIRKSLLHLLLPYCEKPEVDLSKLIIIDYVAGSRDNLIRVVFVHLFRKCLALSSETLPQTLLTHQIESQIELN